MIFLLLTLFFLLLTKIKKVYGLWFMVEPSFQNNKQLTTNNKQACYGNNKIK